MAPDAGRTVSRRNILTSAAGAAAGAALGVFLIEPARFHVMRRRTRVKFWHQLGGEWLEPMQSIIDAFNCSQIEFEIDPLLISDTEADSKLLLSTVGGLPPDVVLTWTQATSEWGESGLLQPLDAFMSSSELDWFKTQTYPVVRKSGWFKGRLYGLVMGFDLWVCYYRPDHFRDAGLDPDHFPDTLEDLVEVGAKLHKIRPNGHIDRIGFLPTGFQTFAPLFGGGFYNEATGELTLNSPENLRCLTLLSECRKRLGFDRVVGFEAALGSDDAASWSFMQSQYSISAEGEWRVEQLRKYAPKLEYRTIPTPPPRGGKKKASFSMTNFLVMPRSALQPQGAWCFIKFWAGLGNPAAAAGFYPILGWMPLGPAVTHARVYQEWLSKAPQYRTFLDVAESNNICITPPVPFQTYLMDQVKKADDAVSRGTLTPENALERLEHDVAHERARRKRLGYVE